MSAMIMSVMSAWTVSISVGDEASDSSPADRKPLVLYGTTYTVNPYENEAQYEGEYTPPGAVPERLETDQESPFLPLSEEYSPVPHATGFFRSGDNVHWFESDDDGHFILHGLPEGDYEVICEQNEKGFHGKKNVTLFYIGGETGLMIYLGPVPEE